MICNSFLAYLHEETIHFYAGLYDLTETIVRSCDPPFEIWVGLNISVCYLRYFSNSYQLNWCDSESNCQSYGSNVHLVGVDTLQV